MPTRPDRRSPGFIVATMAQQIAAYAVAAAAFWPIHQSPAVVVAVGVALFGAAAVSLAGALLRWNAAVVLLATIAAYLLLGVPAAVPDRALARVLPTVPGLADLVQGSALSWKELLTISLPVGSYETLLIPVFLSTLVLGVASMTVALRGRATEFAVLGPVALLLLGIVFGPRTLSGTLAASIGLLVLTVAFVTWTRTRRRGDAIRRVNEQTGTIVEFRTDRRRAAARTAVGAAVILAIAVGGAMGSSALVPVQGPRDVLRAAIERPFDPRDYPSPLSAFRAYVGASGAATEQLAVTGLESGERLRLATLDTYDGTVYTVGDATTASASGTFSRVPFAIDRSAVEGRRASLEVSIEGYSGVWVPDAGRLETIQFDGARGADLRGSFFYNENSGTGAVVSELGRGDSYRLQTVIPADVTEDGIAGLLPGGATLPPVEDVPDEVAAALSGWTSEATSDGERLKAAIDGLRADGYISHGGEGEPFSASGHSAGRIAELLRAQPMLGDGEQYAVTAALLARQLGFPARVVVGFVAPDSAATGATVDFTGADMSAWIEVNASGQGWVAIDPNPPVREIPERLPDTATKVARPQSVIPPPPADQNEAPAQIPPDIEEQQPDTPQPLWLAILFAVLTVAGWVLVALALVAAPFLAVIAAKVRRRRLRRRTGTPLQRITGAWSEFADAAVDSGVDPMPGATRFDLARAVGGRDTLVLAATVDRANFAPGVPEDGDVVGVWESVDRLRGGLLTGRSRWERIKASVTLRSFRRNRAMQSRVVSRAKPGEKS